MKVSHDDPAVVAIVASGVSVGSVAALLVEYNRVLDAVYDADVPIDIHGTCAWCGSVTPSTSHADSCPWPEIEASRKAIRTSKAWGNA